MMNVCNANYSNSRQLLGKQNSNKIVSHSSIADLQQQNQSLNVGGQMSFKGFGGNSKKFLNSEFMYKAASLAANGVFLQSAIVFFINCVPRPLTIMALPGAKPEDKKYAAVKSAASGICDFAITGLLFTQIKKGLDAWTKHPDCIVDKAAKQTTKDLISWGLKYGIGIPQAFIMFAIIPPLMKCIFPNKGKKTEPKPDVKTEAPKSQDSKVAEKKEKPAVNSATPIKGFEQFTQKFTNKAGGNV